MKKRIYYLAFCFIYIAMTFCSFAPLLCEQNISQEICDAKTVQNVASTLEEPSSFSIPKVLDVDDKEHYLFSLSEYNRTNELYIYPTIDLPITINFARDLYINFTNLDEFKYTFNGYNIMKLEVDYGYTENGVYNQVANVIVYENEMNPEGSLDSNFRYKIKMDDIAKKKLAVTITLTYDRLQIINSIEKDSEDITKFYLQGFDEVALTPNNKKIDKDSNVKNLFLWQTSKDGITVDNNEPIFNQTYKKVTLNYSEIIQKTGTIIKNVNGVNITEDVYEDVGLTNIIINGTSYIVSNTEYGEKTIEFEKSGDYTVAIVSPYYQDGINKEYTYRLNTFTIDNEPNIVAYSKNTGSEITNFDENRFQFVNGPVVLKFWGLSVGEQITYTYKPAFGGAQKVGEFYLTKEYIEEGYIINESGEYTITLTNDEVSIATLTFGICNNILKADEKEAIEEKLDSFIALDGEESKMSYDYTVATKIVDTEYINSYSISGLSLQFGTNQNVNTPSSYKYNFNVDYATTPSIQIEPKLSKGQSTTSNITISRPKAAGNWTLTIKYGNTTKTYQSNNFDTITLRENGRYIITLVDETGQSQSLTISKNFKMNIATIILIIVGVIGTGILVIIIIKSRYTIQVK